NNGDYYGKEPPIDGLKAALKLVTLQANSWEWARKTFGTTPAEEGKDPAKVIANRFKIEAFLDQAATARATLADANHFLYLCKANQLAAVDPAKIKAPALVLYAPNDLVFYEPIVQETMRKIAAAKQGKTVHPPDNVTRSHTRRLAFHSGPASYLQR